MQFWYQWSGPDVLTTVSKNTFRGTVEQVLALMYEADLQKHWLPCVVNGVATWSDVVPALVVDIHAKIPVMPKILSTVMHRGFLDRGKDGVSSPGVLIVDWTPKSEHIVDGSYCGMSVPEPPPRCFRGSVQFGACKIVPEPDGRVSVISSNDVNFPRRLAPDFVLRRFFRSNARTCAQKMHECLLDFHSKGYAERVDADGQGVYKSLGRRNLASPS
mmetsp:Transcript_42879/g.114728  ORF Transcript_42879/g.114728 Transcript_42879/m.114728 type:complete len:216 (-) Transcript_42879:96-743(-)